MEATTNTNFPPPYQFASKIPNDESNNQSYIGDWIDLNGLEHLHNDLRNDTSIEDSEEIELLPPIILDITEKKVFEKEVMYSIPYYRNMLNFNTDKNE